MFIALWIKDRAGVNLSGHEGYLQLSLADIVPNMYTIQNEDAGPLSKPLGEEITRKVLEQYTLKHNFPNPSNPGTQITFLASKIG